MYLLVALHVTNSGYAVVVVEIELVVVTAVEAVTLSRLVILKLTCHLPGKFEKIPKLFESLTK